MNVPPRFEPAIDRQGRVRSIVCATISPSSTCSVKFFEPTTTIAAAGRRRTTPASDCRDDSRGRGGDHQRRPAPPSAPPAETALDHGQRRVDGDREQRRGNGAGQDHGRVHHRQAPEDVLAEAAGADRRSDRGGADADHRGHANAGDDRRQRERQLDLPQHAARGVMPHAPARPRRGRGQSSSVLPPWSAPPAAAHRR